ncbi:MAG: SDR family oxidoreductase [Pseudomonadota bacterium]
MTAAFAGFSLTGQVALVTGAARGLGLEIAKALAKSGATTFANGRDAGRLTTALSSAQARDLPIEPLVFDVSDTAQASGAIADIEERHGRLDILVNNVGARDRRALEDFDLSDVRRMLEVDLVAPFHLSREAARVMDEKGGGRIINITSIAGPIAQAGDAAYTAAKGGLEALTRALAAELGPRGITVNGIAPGFFATETNAEAVADPTVSQWLKKRTALGRWGQAPEIAGAAVFLASPAASYVTGHIIAVDGGYLAHF